MRPMARKPGRPQTVIDYEIVEKLASIFCTQEEIAAFLSVPLSTCQKRDEFRKVYKKGLETAKISLRRKQFKLADKNATMAIFLGKNYLGQRDFKETEDPKAHTDDRLKEIADAIEKSDSDPDSISE